MHSTKKILGVLHFFYFYNICISEYGSQLVVEIY